MKVGKRNSLNFCLVSLSVEIKVSKLVDINMWEKKVEMNRKRLEWYTLILNNVLRQHS